MELDVAENNDVNIKMTMTTQGCPLHETLSFKMQLDM